MRVAIRLIRRPHRLRTNVGTEIPRLWLFYDTETYQTPLGTDITKHTLRLGWAVRVRLGDSEHATAEQWFYFRAPHEFWGWVDGCIRSRSKVVLVAHNQHFDFLVADGFRQLPALGWILTKSIIDTDTFVLKWRKETRSLLCADSTLVFRTGLSTIGKTLGLEKGKVNFARAGEEELSAYCRRDVEILKKAYLEWVKWVEQNDLGTYQPTAAAQAFQAFRHRFMKHDIYIHSNQDVLELERESYRGGRTDCFKLGKIDGPIYELDYNSLYPSVMRDNVYPVRLVKHARNISVEDLVNHAEERCVIARCYVELNEPRTCIKRHKLIAPIGRYHATLTTPEILDVYEHGQILSVKEAAIYEAAPIFEDYVDWFYAKRLEARSKGDLIGDMMAKLLLNSLYGKFGQTQREIEIIGSAPPDLFLCERCLDAQTYERYLRQVFGGKVRKICKGKIESYHSFPAIASHVTAYGRCKLWQAIERAGLKHVYYCDTDSLFVDQVGYKRLASMIDPDRLGYLKLRGPHKHFIIYGCKDYILNGVPRLKGVSAQAAQISKDRYEVEIWSRIPSMLYVQIPDSVYVTRKVKQLKREYDKGIVTSSGCVSPLRLFEPPQWFWSAS